MTSKPGRVAGDPAGTVDGVGSYGSYSHMKKAKIAELKNNLFRYLEHVKAGGSVLVLVHRSTSAR